MASELIEVVEESPSPYSRWNPRCRTKTHEILLRILPTDTESRRTLAQEAAAVLSCCVPPTATEGTDTGLVIGYVQSGKTANFTAITAMARDNGYRLVIVIAGNKIELFEQSRDRLKKDLDIEADRNWRFLPYPRDNQQTQDLLRVALQTSDLPGMKPSTAVLVVMKNTTGLRNVNNLLARLPLAHMPTLIIDDEADQASLNTLVNKGKNSPTYIAILNLRDSLPHHTYLQFTATPQALLLIRIIDGLSPSFIELLTPGQAYTGGEVFFDEGQSIGLVREIPETDFPDQPGFDFASPPESLLEALTLFLVGVALGYRMDEFEKNENRSMLIHPAMQNNVQAYYGNWTRRVIDDWRAILDGPDTPDKEELLRDFKKAYDNLVTTSEQLRVVPFDELSAYFRTALHTTVVSMVNQGSKQRPEWKQHYAWILVGGEKLSRGYTVEGLTVTYMPRGLGNSYADTIQQRARWFGYKAAYLGLCRVFLGRDTARAYVSYVQHEQSVRSELADHRELGRSVKEWRRVFLLSDDLRPTREQVTSDPYYKGNISDDWLTPRVPYITDDRNLVNTSLVDAFVAGLHWHPDTGHPRRTDPQKHWVSQVSLQTVMQELLAAFECSSPADAARMTGLLIQLKLHLDQSGDENADIYLMSQGSQRERTITGEGVLPELFQGANPGHHSNEGKYGEFYPGDSGIRGHDCVTVQIHWLVVRKEVGSTKPKTFVDVAQRVPVLAVYVPRRMAAPWLSQEQHD